MSGLEGPVDLRREFDRLVTCATEFRYLIDSQPAGSVPFFPKMKGVSDVRQSETYARAARDLARGEILLQHFESLNTPAEMLVGGMPTGDVEAQDGAKGLAGSNDVLAHVMALLIVLGFEITKQPAAGGVEGGFLVRCLGAEGFVQKGSQPLNHEPGIVHSVSIGAKP